MRDLTALLAYLAWACHARRVKQVVGQAQLTELSSPGIPEITSRNGVDPAIASSNVAEHRHRRHPAKNRLSSSSRRVLARSKISRAATPAAGFNHLSAGGRFPRAVTAVLPRTADLNVFEGSVKAPGDLDVLGREVPVSRSTLEDGDDYEYESYQHSDAVVKVYTVHSGISPSMPWTSKPQDESTGTGFAIKYDDEILILTNAHVVADASYVEVRKAGDATKYMARRMKVSHECDLATLTVDDEAFWCNITALTFGGVPHLQEEVSVVGYPEGGEGISVTAGVVSRIEIQQYAHSNAHLLAIQIDAAINSGNSGGPAVNSADQVIGVAFQNQQQSQNIGYVIPVPTIEHFLADTDPSSNGTRCNGFCALGIFWQGLENEELRKYYGIHNNEHSGVLVRGVNQLSPAKQMIQRGDVLLALDGEKIANDGTIGLAQQRLSFQYIIHRKFIGETVNVRLLRHTKVEEVDVPLQPLHELVPQNVYDEPQPFFLYGGFAFTPLTKPYLEEWGDDWQSHAPLHLVHLLMTGFPKHSDEQAIVLSHCFPSARTAGYSNLDERQVTAINGHRVINIHQMYTLVQELHASSDFVTFELQCSGGNAVVTISTAAAEETLAETMKVYRVPAAASPELLESHAAGQGQRKRQRKKAKEQAKCTRTNPTSAPDIDQLRQPPHPTGSNTSVPCKPYTCGCLGPDGRHEGFESCRLLKDNVGKLAVGDECASQGCDEGAQAQGHTEGLRYEIETQFDRLLGMVGHNGNDVFNISTPPFPEMQLESSLGQLAQTEVEQEEKDETDEMDENDEMAMTFKSTLAGTEDEMDENGEMDEKDETIAKSEMTDDELMEFNAAMKDEEKETPGGHGGAHGEWLKAGDEPEPVLAQMGGSSADVAEAEEEELEVDDEKNDNEIEKEELAGGSRDVIAKITEHDETVQELAVGSKRVKATLKVTWADLDSGEAHSEIMEKKIEAINQVLDSSLAEKMKVDSARDKLKTFEAMQIEEMTEDELAALEKELSKVCGLESPQIMSSTMKQPFIHNWFPMFQVVAMATEGAEAQEEECLIHLSPLDDAPALCTSYS